MSSKVSLEDLKKKRDELAKDLADFKVELEVVKKRKKYSQRLSAIRHIAKTYEMITIDTFSEVSSTFIPPENKYEAQVEKKKLDLYRLCTGIQVNNISMEPILYDDNNPDESWYKFEVKARIEKLSFEVMYVSDQCISDRRTDSDDNAVIKELTIQMTKPIWQCELKDALNYFSENPSLMALAFICLNKYNTLKNVRRAVIKTLISENSEYLEASLNYDTSHIILECRGKYSSEIFFELQWGIIWDLTISSLRDSFNIEIDYENKQFKDEMNPLCVKLCTRDDSRGITQEEKLKIFKNMMVAVKDADTNIVLSNASTADSEI